MTLPLLIMVIEDNDNLRHETTNFLEQNGFDAVGVFCAEDVDDTPLPRSPDIYIVDLNLPGEDGLSLSKRLRRAQPLSGIIITTVRVDLRDRIDGYSMGADVYLPKPFDPQELLATIRALEHRIRYQRPKGGLTLDTSNSTLNGPDAELKLSNPEQRFLVALASAQNQTLERWQVAVQFSPDDECMSADNLQNRVSQVRGKIKKCGVHGEAIKAVRGKGYQLCVPLFIE